jgi:hypothetical protein
MGHLYVLGFNDGSVKAGHANEPAKRVISSAREVAGRCGVTLTQRWVSQAHEGSEMNEKKLIHWARCRGWPVFGFRGVAHAMPTGAACSLEGVTPPGCVDTRKMAINASEWIDNYKVWWTEGQTDLTDGEFRVKIMDGGMLLFDQKEYPGRGFIVAAPQAWTRIKCGPVDPTK